MCGIAGITTKHPADSFMPAAARMADAMSHRGPDSQGIELLGNCILTSARLAILDLSERGRMPMCNAEGNVWITYNGEVYNARELRQQLLQRGYTFRSTTDTEVILHMYEEYGDDCVSFFRGMFAFAIWDGRTSKLLLARDRLGVKPLYLARSGDKILFASEIKTLLASGLIERRLDPAGLRVYLQLGHIPPPWTILRGVTPLEPGHIATWQNGEWQKRAYWTVESLTTSDNSSPEPEIARDLGDVLLDATREHLIADVPIVLFLSGGADSACLAALAQRAGCTNLSAMTVGFAETDYDETALAQRTAAALDLPLKVVRLGPTEVSAGINHAIWAMDQPTVDGLNSYWISKLAAQAGYKVALSGQGADELFGGYTSMAWFERFVNIGRWTSPLPSALSQLFDRESLPFRWRKMSYLFGGDSFVASQLAVKTLYLESDLHRLLPSALRNGGRPSEAERHLTHWAERVADRGLLERLAYMDIEAHLEPRLLRDLDAMSMAHSIEVRPVYLDHRLIEFLLRVPAPVRLHHKRLLFEASRRFLSCELLMDLEKRGKRTFTFPLANWMSQELKPMIEETFSRAHLESSGILESDAVSNLWRRYLKLPTQVGWSRIWNLVVLVRWCEMMDVHP